MKCGFLFVSGSHTQWGLTYLKVYCTTRVVGLCSIQFTSCVLCFGWEIFTEHYGTNGKRKFLGFLGFLFLTETIQWLVQGTVHSGSQTWHWNIHQVSSMIAPLKPPFIRDIPIFSHDFAILSHILYMFIRYLPARSDDTGSAPAPRRAGWGWRRPQEALHEAHE